MTTSETFAFESKNDEDPVLELRRYRKAVARHFKTPEAVCAHHRKMPKSTEEALALLAQKAKTGMKS